jgi:hypothetical protein
MAGSMDRWQMRVAAWVLGTFGHSVLMNRRERAMRVLEEALELAQAEGLGVVDVQRLTERVFSRPVGEPGQEGAGVAVTLFAWASSAGASVEALMREELARIEHPAMVERIRKKQAEKQAAGVGVLPEVG